MTDKSANPHLAPFSTAPHWERCDVTDLRVPGEFCA